MQPRHRLIVATAFTCSLLAGRALSGQEPARQSIQVSRLDSLMRRVQSMVPQSGPPGTRVTLHTGGMPHITPLRIGIGAVRFGFEEIGQVMSDERGEVSLVVTVPGWARRDLTHRFIVFDFYFVPIALSEMFYVTDAEGLLSREGTVLSVGPPCLTLHTDDGLVYSLTGTVPDVTAGARIVVEGRIRESAACPEGTTIEVVRVPAQTR